MASGDQDAKTGTAGPPIVTERDIVFYCGHCQGELVVDRDGVGIEVPCPHCGNALIIPAQPLAVKTGLAPVALAVPAAVPDRFDFSGFSPDQLGRRLEELKHQLKENRSQDTEVRGHVGRATMELHRLQLKLQKLRDRQSEIEAEIEQIKR